MKFSVNFFICKIFFYFSCRCKINTQSNAIPVEECEVGLMCMLTCGVFVRLEFCACLTEYIQ